jgi:AhpC/TSA family/Thiol:disulfide interchange protein DsbD, N-terminal
LQRSLSEIRAQGLGLAAISYDSVETLRAFSDRHGITFPLLSDAGSNTIRAWGILNREATGRAAGIPHPGTFVIDPGGTIVSRAFEQSYMDRDTAASILAGLPFVHAPGKGATEVAGRHVKARTSASDVIAAPGHNLTLFVDVVPAPSIHVYAPGQTGYIPVAVTLDASADYTTTRAVYPAPRTVRLLGDLVQVYNDPFRLTRDVTMTLTPDMRRRAATHATLTLKGALTYQACDETVCYPPDTVPLAWTITLTPIVGRPPPPGRPAR